MHERLLHVDYMYILPKLFSVGLKHHTCAIATTDDPMPSCDVISAITKFHIYFTFPLQIVLKYFHPYAWCDLKITDTAGYQVVAMLINHVYVMLACDKRAWQTPVLNLYFNCTGRYVQDILLKQFHMKSTHVIGYTNTY